MERLPADRAALQELGYRLDEELTHDDIVPFVIRYLKIRTPFSTAFWTINALLLAAWVFSCAYTGFSGLRDAGDLFTDVAQGCAITFLLIPFHEGLHGLAYKICGAPSVTYEAHWRKLYFTASADRFVIGRRSFYLVGLTPFVVITAALLTVAWFVSPAWQVTLLTVAALHAGMCAGDFGLLGYFASKKELEVITYDDMEKGESYFFVR